MIDSLIFYIVLTLKDSCPIWISHCWYSFPDNYRQTHWINLNVYAKKVKSSPFYIVIYA